MTQSTKVQARRAHIVSPGAQLRNATEVSQEVSALLQAVDSIRHSENENEELLRVALDDSAVLELAREIGSSHGEQLDEDKLREALEQVRAQRYVFQEPKAGLNLSIARAWTTRDSWWPKWRMAGLGTAAGTIFAVSAVGMINNHRQSSWVEGIEATRSSEVEIRQALEQSLQGIQPQPNAPLAVVQALGNAQETLRAGIDELGKAPSIPAVNSLEEVWESDKKQAKALLEQRRDRLKVAWDKHEAAKSDINYANSLVRAFEQASVFSQPISVALDGLRTRLRVEFQAAAEAGDVDGMRKAVDTLNSAVGAVRIRDALEAQANNMPSKTRQQLMKRLEDATLAASTGEVDKANILLEETRSLIAQAGMAYTLRIVSEPGVSTGVWRYYDGDRSAKTHYIVVDAIGADGNPIELPITSVEDKNTKTTSRFAIRVPEEVYNQIGEDKRDGIVDNDLMGEKVVGELEPNYAFPVSGGAITSW